MRSATPMILIAALLPTWSALRADDDKRTESLDGTWILQSRSLRGKEFKGEDAKRTKIIIKGNKFTILYNDEVQGVRLLQIDAKQTPKTIDMTPENVTFKTFKGIYKRERDRLTICLGFPNQPRPTDFSGKDGGKTELAVYQLQIHRRTGVR